MKRINKALGFMTVLLIIPLMAFAQASATQELNVSFSSTSLARGSLVLITIPADEQEKPQVTWMDKDVPLIYHTETSSWRGFLPADLNQKAGLYQAVVRSFSTDSETFYPLRVTEMDYGVRVLKLPKDKVNLSPAALERVNREAATIKPLWEAHCRTPQWKGAFLLPVQNTIVGTFGKRSIINNRNRHPHSGVDIRGKIGDPVLAMHSGEIVLAVDHFFTGKSIYLDHGGCIISMYFHLDDFRVEKGDWVEKGQIIGTVGATGRVTGPHLHWGVRVNGAKVNPLTLIDLSREMEKPVN